MLTISSQQMRKLKRGYEEVLTGEYCVRLRSTFSDLLEDVDDLSLWQATQKDVEYASALAFKDKMDIWSFVCLRYRTSSLLESPLYMGVISQILQNLDWSPKKRLIFIERHVLNKNNLTNH